VPWPGPDPGGRSAWSGVAHGPPPWRDGPLDALIVRNSQRANGTAPGWRVPWPALGSRIPCFENVVTTRRVFLKAVDKACRQAGLCGGAGGSHREKSFPPPQRGKKKKKKGGSRVDGGRAWSCALCIVGEIAKHGQGFARLEVQRPLCFALEQALS